MADEKPKKGGAAEVPVAPIIIKKIQGGHGGAHGGAWKIALADMMTAMMAFFLLMWLLGATSEAQRKSIADYFKPTPKSLVQTGQMAGSNGVLGGRSILDPEGLPSAAFQTSLMDTINPRDTEGGKDRDKGAETDPTDAEEQGEGKGGPSQGQAKGGAADGEAKGGQAAEAGATGSGKGAEGDRSGGPAELTEEDKKKIAADLEQKKFDQVEKDLMERLSQDKRLMDLQGQVRLIREKDGLRIEIIDKADFSMFSLGTTRLLPRAQALIEAVAKSVADMPNKVVVRGHTDSLAFNPGDTRNNWTLSAERAESTRQLLERQGVSQGRFARIEGVADTEPFNTSDPADPRNRRISITVKYNEQGG
jgi:chemotaxis protein MotB